MKSNSIMESGYSPTTRTVTWTFRTGASVEYTLREMFAGEREVDFEAYRYGVTVKIERAAAKPRDTATGASASPEEKRAAMQTVADNLKAGVWSTKGGGKKAVAPDSDLVVALAQLKSKTEGTIRAYLLTLDAAKWDAIAATEAVAARIGELRAKRAASVDVVPLLEGIDKL